MFVSMVKDSVHREARACFVSVFNVCYPDWEVHRVNRDLEVGDVEYAPLRSYRGKCGPRRNGRVYFGVRKTFWEDVGRPRQVALVLHELGHVKQLDHSGDFWELVCECFWLAYENRSVLEGCFGEGVMQSDDEWDAVKRHLVFNPTTNMVDNRSETVSERRLEMKELLEWDGDVGKWSGVSLTTFVASRFDSVRVSVDDLCVPESERVSEDELLEWFGNPWVREGVSVKDNGSGYRVEPFVVECVDGEFLESDMGISGGVFDGEVRVVDGFKRAQLYQEVYGGEETTVRCRVVEE